MSFRNRVKYLLVKKLAISNKEAQQLIESGCIAINGIVANTNQLITTYDEVKVNGQLIADPNQFRYAIWYKPPGVECTFDTHTADNLQQHLPIELKDLFYIGRLDKASEGLLLLTNDGSIHDKLLRPEHKIEKTYWVQTLQEPTDEQLQQLRDGITILGKQTFPCFVERTGTRHFHITLIQGINRQIRRMCYKLGLEVVVLKRIRFGKLSLDALKPGEFRMIDREDWK